MIDLVFYSVVEVLSGLAPSYGRSSCCARSSASAWAASGASARRSRWRRCRRAGAACSRACCRRATPSATCSPRCCYFFVFPRWGWRPMFFIGGLPALLALFVRMRVKESEVWEQHAPRELARARARDRRRTGSLFLYLTLLMTMMNFVSHGTQDMYPTFLQARARLQPREHAALIAIIYNVGAIIGGIAFGHYLGPHRPAAAIVTALAARRRCVIPLWAFAPTTAAARRWARSCMQFMVQGAWGVDPRAHHRAVARLRARLPAGLRVPVRRAAREQRRLHRGRVRDPHELRLAMALTALAPSSCLQSVWRWWDGSGRACSSEPPPSSRLRLETV